MFKEPKNYLDDGHFFFEAGKDLENICNAPKGLPGVFKVIELRSGKINLVYLGCTKQFDKFTDNDGLYNEIVSGLHLDKNPRKLGWTYQLIKDKTDAIDVYWYVLDKKENPKKILTDLLRQHMEFYGALPKWNK